MTVQAIQKRYTAADKGLVTEGNELISPENTTLDEANYELLPDKSRRRRRPIREENDLSFALNTGNRTTNVTTDRAAISSYVWNRPGDEDNTAIVVEQAGPVIQFFVNNHDNPTRIQEGYLMDQKIELVNFSRTANKFGNTKAQTEELIGLEQCTYTEGNGMLFISHRLTGTLMVRYREEAASTLGRVIRVSPVGTWIRDFEGADPTVDIHFRGQEVESTDYTNTVNGGLPSRTILQDHGFLGGGLKNNEQYNLSNTGWPDLAILNFYGKTKNSPRSLQGGLSAGIGIPLDPDSGYYPALMDRYADGRQLSEQEGLAAQTTLINDQTIEDFINRSESTFENLNPFAIIAGPQRSAEPAKGRRIKHSDYSPVGHVDPLPRNYLDNATIALEGGVVTISVQLDEPVSHTRGRFPEELKVFIYSMTGAFGNAAPDITGQTGFTGTFDVLRIEDSNTGVTHEENDIIVFQVPEWYGVVPTLTSLWMFDPTTYTSHIGWQPQGTEGPSYDYREQARPAAAAFMDGRLFQLEDEHRRVYFSQLLQYNPQGDVDYPMIRAGMCYTEADPTDPDDSAIVSSDGGYINMSSAGDMIATIVFNRSLLVFTSSGVWEITGNRQFSPFEPDDYSVRKINEAGIVGAGSVVLAQDSVMYLSNEGFIGITADPRTGNLQTQNLTDKTIRSKLDSLSYQQQRDVRVAYDRKDKTIRWVFPDRSAPTTQSMFSGETTMLTLSQLHGAWTIYTTPEFGIADIQVMPYDMNLPTYNRYRYLVVQEIPNAPVPALPVYIRWALEVEFNDVGGVDWIEANNPLDFTDTTRFRDFQEFDFLNPRGATPGFLDTNHHMLGDGTRWMTIHYLTTYNRQVESSWLTVGNEVFPNVPGSTLLSFRWDWSDHEKFGKFTAPIETYRRRRSYIPGLETAHESGEPLLVVKSKIRGRGREFRARWDTNEHYDSHIVGWTVEGTVGSAV